MGQLRVSTVCTPCNLTKQGAGLKVVQAGGLHDLKGSFHGGVRGMLRHDLALGDLKKGAASMSCDALDLKAVSYCHQSLWFCPK